MSLFVKFCRVPASILKIVEYEDDSFNHCYYRARKYIFILTDFSFLPFLYFFFLFVSFFDFGLFWFISLIYPLLSADFDFTFQVFLYLVFYLYFLFTHFNRLIGLVGRVFTSWQGDRGSIPGRVIPKTLKIVLDTYLPNTQQYKVLIKVKVDQSRERSCALPYTFVL